MTGIDEAYASHDHAETSDNALAQDDDYPTGMLASPTRTRI